MPRTSIIQASFNRLHILSPRFVPRIPVRAALQVHPIFCRTAGSGRLLTVVFHDPTQIQAVPRTSIIVCDLSLLSVPTLSRQRALSSAAVAAQSGGAVVGGDAIVAFNLARVGAPLVFIRLNDSPHSPAAAATSPPQPPHHEEQQIRF